jgi:hypothetical protein
MGLGSDVSCQIKTVCAAGIYRRRSPRADRAVYFPNTGLGVRDAEGCFLASMFYDSARIIARRTLPIKSGNRSCAVLVSLLFENVSQHPGKVIGASSGSIGDLLAATGSHRHNRRVGRQRTDSREERALADLL